MIDAIDWGIAHHLDILNLSLGTTQLRFRDPIAAASQRAQDANLLLVSAVQRSGGWSLPAILPNVLGVAAGCIRGRYRYLFRPQHAVQCVARGDMQRVADINGRSVFAGGSSYAAPHMTGIVALIQQMYPGITFSVISELLACHAASVGWSDAYIEAHLIGDDFFQKLLLQAQQVQDQHSSSSAPIETPLEREIGMLVAHILNLSPEQLAALSHRSLLDPVFKLNPRSAIAIIETLERRYQISIPDEELAIEDFFSVNSLAASVRRWSTGATAQLLDN